MHSFIVGDKLANFTYILLYIFNRSAIKYIAVLIRKGHNYIVLGMLNLKNKYRDFNKSRVKEYMVQKGYPLTSKVISLRQMHRDKATSVSIVSLL